MPLIAEEFHAKLQLKSFRNSWHSYIFVDDVRYKYSAIGGVDPFDIPIENNTDFLLDEVVVAVD